MILNCNCYQLIFILDLQSIGNLGYVAVSYLYMLLVVVVVVVVEAVVARNNFFCCWNICVQYTQWFRVISRPCVAGAFLQKASSQSELGT